MVSNDQRRKVAARLREVETLEYDGDVWCDEGDVLDALGLYNNDDPSSCDPEKVAFLADLIEPQLIDGETSDGYHTFNELYHHRAVLFSVIVSNFSDRAWKSKLHADGTMYDGMFIVGIETPDGQATYHYDVEPYWDLFRCKEVDRAPEWDGHTPDQAIERIGKLADREHE